MKTKVTVDKAGRLVLPKSFREDLRLQPGDELEIRREADTILLSPLRTPGTLHKEHGVWVYRSGKPATHSLTELIEEDRRNRDREIVR